MRDIASAADELAASVSEIDRQVAQSNAIATKAVSEAERTNATVKELNEAAGRIGDVVKLITDIAEQTNLLALNATIEAARAGDAGRGFAVVASEVKALAGQTAKATEDIGAQIAGMQHATMRSIEAIGAIERTIREIGDISGAIAAAVTEQGAATQEIARSVETAAERTTETADEVVRVGEATAATRNSADAVKSVADDLGSVAARVRGQVETFFHKLARRIAAVTVFTGRRRTPPGCAAACGPAPPAWRRSGYRGCDCRRESASHASAAATMRARCRSVTDQAASSSRSRAFTSTNTRRLRRRATMSISPTGLFQRRARMRKPFGDEQRRRPAFRRDAGAERDLTLRARSAAGDRRGARAFTRHRRGPLCLLLASASAR